MLRLPWCQDFSFRFFFALGSLQRRGRMEELGTMWSYEEDIGELKQKLLYTTIELESLKAEANEEMRKHSEDVKQLINLLKLAYQERDEAKIQLQKILNKLMLSSPTELQHVLPQTQTESPIVIPAKANSSTTESNSLSDTYNHQSHGSSPADSFFDAVTSPEFSSINMADSSHMGFGNKTFTPEYNLPISTGLVTPAVAKINPADAVINNYIKGKVLPQKGKLLQTMMETGPLLKTILVAGPLPQWRNPPPLLPFKIPPVSLKGCETGNISNQKPAAIASYVAQKPLSSTSYPEISRGSSQLCSASVLNFAGGASSSVLGNGCLLSSGSIDQIPTGKRQRLH